MLGTSQKVREMGRKGQMPIARPMPRGRLLKSHLVASLVARVRMPKRVKHKKLPLNLDMDWAKFCNPATTAYIVLSMSLGQSREIKTQPGMKAHIEATSSMMEAEQKYQALSGIPILRFHRITIAMSRMQVICCSTEVTRKARRKVQRETKR